MFLRYSIFSFLLFPWHSRLLLIFFFAGKRSTLTENRVTLLDEVGKFEKATETIENSVSLRAPRMCVCARWGAHLTYPFIHVTTTNFLLLSVFFLCSAFVRLQPTWIVISTFFHVRVCLEQPRIGVGRPSERIVRIQEGTRELHRS